ncbi:amidohydrolase family protein [Novosphingobium sp. G106]|uniref:N-acyl-D-amino-acid deacylase family protein n=1 Tax=Novosphingobium sp. G106 TaxID=2849500 RepID=UPI0028124005|nr:amidohydrolase family protein [Novosphingobium sp. G106]
MYDLVIRNGTVVDGTGGKPYIADLAVSSGIIAAIGTISETGTEEIDAAGCIVTPGFVDVHTHYDGQVTWENRLAPSSDHGTTTVVMGNCGVGFAPCRPTDRDGMVSLLEGVEDIPGVVMTEGLPWNWETFPQYMDAIEERHADIDFAAQLPHSPLRVFVMGERGINLETPTDKDLAEMRRLTTEAVRAGALGVSTSLNVAHRYPDGAFAPTVKSKPRELIALAEGLRDANMGVFQLLGDYNLPADAQFDITRQVAEAAGRPLSFTFAQAPNDPDGWRCALRGMEEANARGVVIRGQVLPRPTGALLGLELSFHPFYFYPSYQAIADLPIAERVAAMRNPELRAKILSEEAGKHSNDFFNFIITEKDMLFVLGDPPNYNPLPEESLGAIARSQGRDVMEVIYDVLLQRDGHEIIYRPLGNLQNEPRFESAGRDLLRHEHTIIGLGDGGAHYGMICDAAFTTYLLTYWLNDATPAYRLPLAEAIKILTHEPAVAVGLCDRGQLKTGYKADINVIDLARLKLHAPRPAYDLPAGGRRLTQKADGYVATIVSGEVTYRNGEWTGALAGRLQRYAREVPETIAT